MAFALAAVMLLGGSGIQTSSAASSSGGSKAAGPSPLSQLLGRMDPAEAQYVMEEAKIARDTPSSLNSTARYVLETYPGAAGPKLASETTDILEGCGAGALLGASLGAFGGPAAVAGAITGCAVGALSTYLGYQEGESAAEAALQSEAAAFESTEQDAVNNEVNLSNQLLTSLASALNLTQYGMDAWAESAALAQLPDNTFNQAEDIGNTSIGYDLTAPMLMYGSNMVQLVNSTYQWWLAKYGPNGQFDQCNIAGGYLIGFWANTPYAETCSSPSAYAADLFNGGAFVNGPALIEQGASFSMPGAATLTELGGSCRFTSPSASIYRVDAFPCPTGTYLSSEPAGSQIAIGDVAPAAVPGAATTISGCYSIGGTVWTALDGAALSLGNGCVNTGKPLNLTSQVGCGTGCETTNTAWYASRVTSTLPYYFNQTKQMEQNAANSAEFYWQYLRGLGYTNESQIPSNCQIPQPYVALPPNVNLGNLTVSDYEALYWSWVNAVGSYYGVNASKVSNSCGNTNKLGPTQWVTNLTVNTTVSIYIANATEYPGENGSNVSTWAYSHVQAVWWPELSAVTIPVGAIYQVPQNDPIEAVIPSRSAYLTLTGVGPPIKSAAIPLGAAGDEIFIWSCTVNGLPASNCTVGNQNITTVIENITCSGLCGLQPPPSGGGIFTLPDPFAAIANWLGSLFGGGALGSLLGGLATGLIVLALILVAIYAVYVLLSRSKSGGRGSSGGGTVVVTGGGR